MRSGVLVGLLAVAGCAAVTGLADYEIDDRPVDAGAAASSGSVDGSGGRQPTDGAPPEGGGADADAEPDADASSSCDACGRGVARAVCVQNACVPTRRVFVTHATFGAVFSGFFGADMACDTTARNAGLGGTWLSWTSGNATSPKNRFQFASVAYRLLDGTEIAASGSVFTNGQITLEHAIDHDENGVLVTSPHGVWTGTNEKGDVTSSCQGWSTAASGAAGEAGELTSIDTTWTAAGLITCASQNHLYCFEQ